MRLAYSLTLIIALGFFAGGCSSARVYSDRAQGVNFAAYNTYAWLPNHRDTTNGSVLKNEITYQNVREAVNEEMRARGYVLDANNPDLLLMTNLNFERREELVSRPFYSSFNYYYPGFYSGPWYPYYYGGYYNIPYVHGYGIEQVQYTEGTVVVDVIDRAKNQLLWRGWSEERLYDYEDRDEMYENVKKIFDEYPVKKNKRLK